MGISSSMSHCICLHIRSVMILQVCRLNSLCCMEHIFQISGNERAREMRQMPTDMALATMNGVYLFCVCCQDKCPVCMSSHDDDGLNKTQYNENSVTNCHPMNYCETIALVHCLCDACVYVENVCRSHFVFGKCTINESFICIVTQIADAILRTEQCERKSVMQRERC